MNTTTFDTHKEIENLIKKGIEKKHAEGIIEALQKSRETDLSQLITKDYFENKLDAKLYRLKYEMVAWLIFATATIISVLKLL